MKKALSLSLKTVLLLILSALLIASAGFLMSLNLTTAEAETSASEERIATNVVLEDSWSVDSQRKISCGKNYDYTFSTTGKPVSRKYEIKLNDFLANEWGGSKYNHMWVLYGRLDMITAYWDVWSRNEFSVSMNPQKLNTAYPNLFNTTESTIITLGSLGGGADLKYLDKTGTAKSFEVGKVNPFLFSVNWDEGNIYNLGYIVFYAYTTGISGEHLRNVALFSSTPKTDIINYLSSNSDYAQKDESGLSVAFTKDYPMARALGVAPDLESNGQVNVKYQKLVDGHFNVYENVEESFTLARSEDKSLFPSENNVLAMLRAANTNFAENGLAAFNTYYTSNTGYFM
ncbi:MAG: hypothetical protein SPL13_03515, partial [Clostridia bacterium]|nr:hypothetical protein [Clostridia bacterium]